MDEKLIRIIRSNRISCLLFFQLTVATWRNKEIIVEVL
jgi:hypothetical protein